MTPYKLPGLLDSACKLDFSVPKTLRADVGVVRWGGAVRPRAAHSPQPKRRSRAHPPLRAGSGSGRSVRLWPRPEPPCKGADKGVCFMHLYFWAVRHKGCIKQTGSVKEQTKGVILSTPISGNEADDVRVRACCSPNQGAVEQQTKGFML